MRISKVVSTIVFILFTIQGVFSQNYTKQISTGDYNLVWQDNFDGNTLDEKNNWNIEVNGNGGGNSELQYYRRENISVGLEPVSGANCLIITGKKENYLGKTCTSGRLTTQNKVTFQYGKLEARIKLPKTANGLWPAFWMLGTNIPTAGWPACGEVDIMEMGSRTGINAGTQDKYFSGACHWGNYVNGSYPNYAKATTNSYGLQDDFHLFTLIWNPQYISMYLDLDKYPNAAPYYQMGITAKTTTQDPYEYFNSDFFVLFNLAIGGNFPQIWDINQITALNNGDVKMYVDYVKLYQRGDAGETYSGPALTALHSIQTINKFKVYPNPFTDEINIEGSSKLVSAIIFNLSGQKLLESTTNKINTSTLQRGNYILKVIDENGNSETQKITK